MQPVPTPPVPQHCPTPVELDDLELLTSGALGDPAAFNQPGSPVTLTLPEPVAAQAGSVGAVELVDPEGLPLARVSWPGGVVDPLTHAQYGPFRDLMLTPAAYRERYAGRTVVPVSDPLTTAQVEELAGLGPVTLLALTGTGTPVALAGRPGPRDPRRRRAAAGRRRRHRAAAVARRRRGRPRTRRAGRRGVRGGRPGARPRRRRRRRAARRGRRGRGPRPPATGPAGAGAVLHRPVRQRQVHAGPRAGRPAARAGRADRDQPRRRRRTPEPLGRADLLQGGPGDQHPPDRLGGRRDLPARRGRGGEPDRAVRRDPPAGPGHGRRTPAARSSWSTSPRRSRSASAATARGSTPGRGPARSRSSPASPRRTRSRRTPTSGSTPPAGPSRTPSATCWSGCARRGTSTCDAEGPVRLHGQHLPLAVGRGAGPRRGASRTWCSAAPAPTRRDGEPINPDMVAVLPPELDTSEFRSRRLTSALLEDADLVVTMEAAHRTFVLDDHPGMFRKVFTLGQLAKALEQAPDGLDRDAPAGPSGRHSPERRSGTRRAGPLSSGGRGRLRVRGAPR